LAFSSARQAVTLVEKYFVCWRSPFFFMGHVVVWNSFCIGIFFLCSRFYRRWSKKSQARRKTSGL
jgi:hypothetical protein